MTFLPKEFFKAFFFSSLCYCCWEVVSKAHNEDVLTRSCPLTSPLPVQVRMAYHQFLYQRPADLHSSQAALTSPFLAQPHRPQFPLPLGGPFSLAGGPPGPPGFPYCGAAPGIAAGGAAVMGMGQNLLLAEYLAHPDYYRQLRWASRGSAQTFGIVKDADILKST